MGRKPVEKSTCYQCGGQFTGAGYFCKKRCAALFGETWVEVLIAHDNGRYCDRCRAFVVGRCRHTETPTPKDKKLHTVEMEVEAQDDVKRHKLALEDAKALAREILDLEA